VTELTISDPCVVFALARESAFFCRQFRPQQRFPGAPCRARFCGPPWLSVLVLETGVGPDRAATAADWLLSGLALGGVPYRPRVVIAAGYAGALRPERCLGDVVLATEVLGADGGRWPATWPGELSGR
jgi:nucleoside phosphorylase